MAKLIDEKELAEFLCLSVLTLRRTRCCNLDRHPPFLKIGSAVRYDPAVVVQWLKTREMNGMNAPLNSPESEFSEQRKRGRPHKTGKKR